jgi:hypothetical protein
MAYKQVPGRGNQAKTGRGIPAPFKQTPDYAAEDRRENAAQQDYTTTNAAKGVSYTAGRMLENFPAQKKHVIKNFQKDEKTGSSSWETKVNAREAVQAMQVGRDSIAHIGNERNPELREKLGKQFHNAWSPYNKINKKEQDRSGKGYQGPNGVSGTNADKSEVLRKLKLEGVLHGGYATAPDVPEKEFGLKPAPAPAKANPKSGATKKKSPMKQTAPAKKMDKSMDKMDKSMPKGPRDSKAGKDMAKGPEVKKPNSPAKMKKTPAKMKKC